MKIEVLIADDHAIIRDGIRRILADTEDFIVAGEARDGAETLAKVRERKWDLLILDISMPGRNGPELIKLIKSERPLLPILVFSMHSEEQYAVRALRAGASGYLTKDADGDLLLPALRRVAGGRAYISPQVAELLATDMGRHSEALPHTLLSNREYEVFIKLAAGVSVSDIARELSLSVKTVSTHKTNILAKMQLATQVDLARYALEHQLID